MFNRKVWTKGIFAALLVGLLTFGWTTPVLAFDRDRLRMRYRLELLDDSWSEPRAEAEEYVSGDVPLGFALIGIVAEPSPNRSREVRREVWRVRMKNLTQALEASRRSVGSQEAMRSLAKEPHVRTAGQRQTAADINWPRSNRSPDRDR